ncbi:MAG: hypothetical protein ACODTL_17780 [Brucella sp.]|uniref:Uncharacterized protein n=1 Tax=Brucella tritici TaxID=94626 RepID=A0A6L3YV12_9HYPH|nr:hypothetical protein [Brucella tritici]KAB2688925.1 hypothetical protein F9L08_04480 [Brucella tritici]
MKNAKLQMFAKGVAEGLTADGAYQRTGFEPDLGNAIRLKANENILKRIDKRCFRVAKQATLLWDLTVEVGRSLRTLFAANSGTFISPKHDARGDYHRRRQHAYDNRE